MNNPYFFCGFPGYKPVPPGWFKICVGFIMGTPKGLPKGFFMEKPGIEPVTPGLQGIDLSPTPRWLLHILPCYIVCLLHLMHIFKCKFLSLKQTL